MQIYTYICFMRKHNGMRQQDVVVLLKMLALGDKPWQLKDLASSLYISPSEISESLNRSQFAGLVSYDKKKVNRLNFYDFISHGFKYVFPQQPGSIGKGIGTAHAHPFLKKYILSDMPYVWPDAESKERGLCIEPLYPNQVKAVKADSQLYKMLALTDALRVGKAREVKLANAELKKMILDE